MSINNLIREIELKEEGIKNLLGERENYEFDIEEEGISLSTKRLIAREMKRIDTNIWLLQSGITSIKKKINRMRG